MHNSGSEQALKQDISKLNGISNSRFPVMCLRETIQLYNTMKKQENSHISEDNVYMTEKKTSAPELRNGNDLLEERVIQIYREIFVVSVLYDCQLSY